METFLLHAEKSWTRRNLIGETKPKDIKISKKLKTTNLPGVLRGFFGRLGSSQGSKAPWLDKKLS